MRLSSAWISVEDSEHGRALPDKGSSVNSFSCPGLNAGYPLLPAANAVRTCVRVRLPDEAANPHAPYGTQDFKPSRRSVDRGTEWRESAFLGVFLVIQIDFRPVLEGEL